MNHNHAFGAQPCEAAPRGTAAMAVDIPPSHHRIPYFQRLADALSGHTDAPACTLLLDGPRFAGRQALDAVLSREVEMAWLNASHLENLAPELTVLMAPFSTDDHALGRSGAAVALVDLLDSVLKGSGVRVLGVMRGADQLLVHPSGRMDDVAQLKERRVRVAGPGVYVELMNALGAHSVEMPIPKIADAFTSGAVDCVFTSPGGWKTQVFHSARHATWVPGLMFINYILIANEDWAAALPAQALARLRRTVDREVTDAWSSMRLDDERLLDQMRQEGAQITQVQDTLPWRARTAPMAALIARRFPKMADALQRIQG